MGGAQTQKKLRRMLNKEVQEIVKRDVTGFKEEVNKMKFLERARVAVRVLRGRL